MKLFFTGEKGMLARQIMSHLPPGMEVPVVNRDYQGVVSMVHPWPEVDVRNFESLMAAVDESGADAVVHSGAIVNTDKCASRPQDCVNINLMGTHNVLEVCRLLGKKLLYFSTTATYDPEAERPFREHRTPQRAPTLYGITKLAGEHLVRGQDQVPHMVVRPCFVYGDPPYDHSSQLCRVAVHQALLKWWPERAGDRLKVTLDPTKRKDYMRVEDFAAAVVKILELDSWNGDVFNVSNHGARPMAWYFEALRQLSGVSQLDMSWISSADYMGDHLVDSNKLRACTGWTPAISPEEGVRRLAVSAKTYVQDCQFGKDVLLYK